MEPRIPPPTCPVCGKSMVYECRYGVSRYVCYNDDDPSVQYHLEIVEVQKAMQQYIDQLETLIEKRK